MSTQKHAVRSSRSPSRIGLVAMYLAFAAVVARTVTSESVSPVISRYLGLELVFLVLYTAGFVWRNMPVWLAHLYFALQSVLVLLMLSLQPEFDFVVLIYAGLSYQVALLFMGRVRWGWVFILVALTGGALIFHLGLVRGTALALTTMAGAIVIPAYVMVVQETEAAQAKSQDLLEELQNTHQQLQTYAGQVEELAALQERNRLARELHDSVSQLMFSIALTTRSAQLLIDHDPARVPEQLARIQEITADALSRLRALITQLRPPQQT